MKLCFSDSECFVDGSLLRICEMVEFPLFDEMEQVGKCLETEPSAETAASLDPRFRPLVTKSRSGGEEKAGPFRARLSARNESCYQMRKRGRPRRIRRTSTDCCTPACMAIEEGWAPNGITGSQSWSLRFADCFFLQPSVRRAKLCALVRAQLQLLTVQVTKVVIGSSAERVCA